MDKLLLVIIIIHKMYHCDLKSCPDLDFHNHFNFLEKEILKIVLFGYLMVYCESINLFQNLYYFVSQQLQWKYMENI